ncbi:MAG: FlgD immunoglobulin-like domain containing protein [bacterium]|nr:FlgD immunoglobulin-like domain containing protein [bacterium]
MITLISLLYLIGAGQTNMIPVDMGKLGKKVAVCNSESDISALKSRFFGSKKGSKSDSSNIHFVARTLHGLGYCVFVKDTFTYYSEGGELIILNTSNPANPTLISEFSSSSLINNIYVSGNYAYLSNREAGLVIVDVSNPANPVEAGHYSDSLEAWYSCVSGNYAYVIDFWMGQLQVLDIQNPANIVLVGTYGESQLFGEIYVSGNYAYITDRGLGTTSCFITLDISNPAAIRKTGSINVAGYPSGICVKDTFAYVAAGTTVKILNIADTIPKLVKSCNTYSYAYDICVNNNYVYAGEILDYRSNAFRYGRLEIIDISVPESAKVVGVDSNMVYGTYGISYFDGNIYGACSTEGLEIINVSDADSPTVTGKYNSYENIAKVEISNNYGYAYNYARGVKVLDVSSPQTPQRAGEIPMNMLLDINVAGNYLYASLYSDSTGDSGIIVKDISNPLSPVDKSVWVNPGAADTVYYRWIAAANNYVYAYNYNKTIDIMNDSLNKVGSYNFPYITNFLCIDSNYMYVTDYVGKKLYAISVSNPAAPESIGVWSGAKDYLLNMAISGQYGYIVTPDSGLRIVDISRAISLKEVGNYCPEGSWNSDVCVSGKYAYTTDYTAGVTAVDVSDPAAPKEAGYYYIDMMPFLANLGVFFFPASDVYVSGDYIYVVNSDCGVYVLQSSFPGISEEKGNVKEALSIESFPNPFKRETSICYYVNGNGKTDVSLKVYDAGGREVSTLVNNSCMPGKYTVKWSGKNNSGNKVSAGVYFVRLNVNGKTVNSKMLLMK